jgi:hypothetical protein
MMQSAVATPDQYIHEVDEVRRPTLIQLRNSILNNLPKGFEEIISYGMIN